MMLRKNSRHKTPYHEAYAVIGELKKRPNDAKLVQLALRVVFGIIIADPESTAAQGGEHDVIYRSHIPSFRFESMESRSAGIYGLSGRYAVIFGGIMLSLTDPCIPFMGRYVSIAASDGQSYRAFKMPMRRFLANLKAIDGDSSISAYCMMRGIDLRYRPQARMIDGD